MHFPLTRRSLLATPVLAAPVLAVLAPGRAQAQAQAGLGLAERRAIAAYREQVFPGVLAEINEAAKTPLEVEANWDGIALPGQAAQYAGPGYWTSIYFTPLIQALRAVTADAMGRDAVKAKLRRVVVAYNPDTAPASNYPKGLKFADGTLTINWHPNSNAGDMKERTEAIQKALEAGL